MAVTLQEAADAVSRVATYWAEHKGINHPDDDKAREEVVRDLVRLGVRFPDSPDHTSEATESIYVTRLFRELIGPEFVERLNGRLEISELRVQVMSPLFASIGERYAYELAIPYDEYFGQTRMMRIIGLPLPYRISEVFDLFDNGELGEYINDDLRYAAHIDDAYWVEEDDDVDEDYKLDAPLGSTC